MIRHTVPAVALLSSILFSLPAALNAQAPGVRVVRDRVGPSAEIAKQANEARVAGRLLDKEMVRGQMKRTHCDVKLPEPASQELSGRQIWERAQAAYVRVGWHYLCKRCDESHQNLAGGYFVTEDGVVATCHHVVEPKANHREAYLIAVSALGECWPVTEVLAANDGADAALLQNAIGHVSEISAVGNSRDKNANQPANALITFHHAARAADVLALARPPGTSTTTCQPVETDPP